MNSTELYKTNIENILTEESIFYLKQIINHQLSIHKKEKLTTYNNDF